MRAWLARWLDGIAGRPVLGRVVHVIDIVAQLTVSLLVLWFVVVVLLWDGR